MNAEEWLLSARGIDKEIRDDGERKGVMIMATKQQEISALKKKAVSGCTFQASYRIHRQPIGQG